jgi:hypothetical protein
MKQRMAVILTAALALALAVPGWAKVKITQASISPKILLEIYQNSKTNTGTIDWASPNIFLMNVVSDVQSAGQTFNFVMEIAEGNVKVADIKVFRVLSRPLVLGSNLFNASDINAEGLTMTFNENYKYGMDSGTSSQGQVLPMVTYRVTLRPVEPTPGDPFTLALSLFTPSSAINQPPVPVYPNQIEINTVLPNFAWTTVTQAATYEVTLGPDPNPETNSYWRSGPVFGTQTLYLPSARALENGRKYYWQVRAFDSLKQPVGGVDGRSQPAVFTINTLTTANTSVAPAEVEAALKSKAPDPAVFKDLTVYKPVAIETNAADLKDLLRQLRAGSAKIIALRLE